MSRAPAGRERPASLNACVSSCLAWTSDCARGFTCCPPLCHCPRHCQRCIWRYRGARTRWNCELSLHVCTTFSHGYPPASITLSSTALSFYSFSACIFLQLIFFYRAFPHYTWSGKGEEWTDVCTSETLQGKIIIYLFVWVWIASSELITLQSSFCVWFTLTDKLVSVKRWIEEPKPFSFQFQENIAST